MTTQVQELLVNFDQLFLPEQQELAAEIMRRISVMDWPPLTDDDLNRIADERFIELDKEEEPDAKSSLLQPL